MSILPNVRNKPLPGAARPAAQHRHFNVQRSPRHIAYLYILVESRKILLGNGGRDAEPQGAQVIVPRGIDPLSESDASAVMITIKEQLPGRDELPPRAVGEHQHEQ